MKKVIRSVWILVSLWLVLAYVGGALPGPARTVKRAAAVSTLQGP